MLGLKDNSLQLVCTFNKSFDNVFTECGYIHAVAGNHYPVLCRLNYKQYNPNLNITLCAVTSRLGDAI